MNAGAARFPIRFDPWYAAFSSALFLRPARSWIEVSGDAVAVQMGWAFRARFPRACVASTRRYAATPVSRGVHGFAGRWLVNGAGDRVLAIELAPAQRAYVLGIPVRLQSLLVSVDEPDGLAASLRRA